MITAFGARATEYAHGLGELDAIVAEPAFVRHAYAEAVLRRERGEPFYGMLLLDEPRTQSVVTLAPIFLQQYPDDDMRRDVFRNLATGKLQLNGKPSSEWFAQVDATMQQLAREFYQLSDAILVRSFFEYERLRAYQFRPRPFERVVVVPAVPDVARRRPARPAVVVWAPRVPAVHLAGHAFGLAEFLGDVTIVCAGGDVPPVRGIVWLAVADSAVDAALETTTCVMTADPCDPGDAIAFARAGYGVVAPVTSGAHEYVRDAQTYDLLLMHTIHTSVAAAIALPASIRELPARLPVRPALPVAEIAPSEAPLVSVVIPTYNRPDDLRNCLRYVREQTYRHLEVIVVNDAGSSVEHVVAEFPGTVLVNLARNSGVTIAEMTGVERARGRYIQLAADDDCIYPDHIERLVRAMERCGAAVGHTNGLIRYQRRMPDRSLRTQGFNSGVFIETTTPSAALISTPISGQGLMWRADVFDEIGPWREDCELADQEVQLRAANRYVFVFVDVTTNEWRVRVGESYAVYDAVQEMRNMYALHPVDDRPFIQQWREESIANVALRPKTGGPVFEASFAFEPGEVRTSS